MTQDDIDTLRTVLEIGIVFAGSKVSEAEGIAATETLEALIDLASGDKGFPESVEPE